MTHIEHGEKMLVMRIFISVLVLIFSLQSLTKADDINEFEIEGMSIGDSALDFFSKEEIKNFKIVEYPSSKRIIGWESPASMKFKKYIAITFHVKSNDKNYEILSIKGMLDMENKKKECLDKKKKIVDEIKSFLNLKEDYSYEANFGNKAGKSIAYITDFDLESGSIRIWCTVWDKKNETSKNWIDTLNVSVGSEYFFDFLNNEAYK